MSETDEAFPEAEVRSIDRARPRCLGPAQHASKSSVVEQHGWVELFVAFRCCLRA